MAENDKRLATQNERIKELLQEKSFFRFSIKLALMEYRRGDLGKMVETLERAIDKTQTDREEREATVDALTLAMGFDEEKSDVEQ